MTRLAELIQQTLQQFSTQAEQDNIALTFQTMEDNPAIQAGNDAISHDFALLLNHLISFTPEFGEINIALAQNENHDWILSVTNTGIDLHAYTALLNSMDS